MPLTSMKMTAAERKQSEPSSLAGGEPEGARYPYGLELRLEDDTLEKLELDDLPAVGTVMTLIARVEVTSVSSNQGPDKTKRKAVSLQITNCCLEAGSPPANIEETIYGAKD